MVTRVYNSKWRSKHDKKFHTFRCKCKCCERRLEDERYLPIIEVKGRDSFNMEVGINGDRYEDWISLDTHEGTIILQGVHVLELWETLLRYSSRKMRNCFQHLLTLTSHVKGEKLFEPFKRSHYNIEWEKSNRKHYKKWNKIWEAKRTMHLSIEEQEKFEEET
mgnify:FL=1